LHDTHKAQVERDYRRAVEKFERLKKVRDELIPSRDCERADRLRQTNPPNGAEQALQTPDSQVPIPSPHLLPVTTEIRRTVRIASALMHRNFRHCKG
jgi:hypothetical protein